MSDTSASVPDFTKLRSEILEGMLKRAVDAYNAMTPEQKAAHDYEQRRSFVRGMCPDSRDYNEWCRVVDRYLPPRQ